MQSCGERICERPEALGPVRTFDHDAICMRLVDPVAAKRRQPTLTGDISNAFFHAVEDEEVYVQPSAEWYAIYPEHEGMVWRMLKQIYGRCKATRKFAYHMSGILVNECGLEQSKAAPHLYRCLRRGIV